MAKTKNIDTRDWLNEIAGELLKYIGSIDPTWASRIDITRTERGMDDLQTIGSYVVQILEREEHMMVPNHPFFTKEFGTAYEPKACLWCGVIFNPDYPGKLLCTNNCAKHYYDANPIKVD